MKDFYDIKGKKFFITGGAGFIGTSLAKVLAKENQITLFDNLHNNAFVNTDLNQNPNIKLVKGDVLDYPALESSMDPGIDYILHCAAIAGVDTVIKNPIMTLEVNIQGTLNVFRAADKLSGLKRIIDFSTSEIYGTHAKNADENTVSPSLSLGDLRWSYAISKLSGEAISRTYNLHKGIPTVTIRPFNIFGPNQVGIGAVHNFVVNAIKGQPLIVYNTGEQIRSWCYIDDFVKGVLLSMEKNIAIGKTYNIGNPDNTLSSYELAESVRNISGSRSTIEFKKTNYPDVELRIPGISMAHRQLSFTPVISMEEGLKRTIEWYRSKNGDGN